MVPENGTEVVVAWTGRFDQSVVLMGNARSEDAEFASPSTWLEDEYRAQYADVHVVEIGRTSVDDHRVSAGINATPKVFLRNAVAKDTVWREDFQF